MANLVFLREYRRKTDYRPPAKEQEPLVWVVVDEIAAWRGIRNAMIFTLALAGIIALIVWWL